MVILITAFGDVELAIRAIKEGATDFVLKPWQNEKLLATLSSALALRRSRIEVDTLRSRQERISADLDRPFKDFIGRAGHPVRLRRCGKAGFNRRQCSHPRENGTGKELVARSFTVNPPGRPKCLSPSIWAP